MATRSIGSLKKRYINHKKELITKLLFMVSNRYNF